MFVSDGDEAADNPSTASSPPSPEISAESIKLIEVDERNRTISFEGGNGRTISFEREAADEARVSPELCIPKYDESDHRARFATTNSASQITIEPTSSGQTGTTRPSAVYRQKKSNILKQNRDSWILDPEDPEHARFLKKWDITGGSALILVAVITPFEAGFLDSTQGGWAMEVLHYFNLVINVFFALDVILQFFLPFQKKLRFGTAWIYKRKEIIKNYLKHWFLIDLVSILPFELMAPGKPVGVFRVIRLLRLFKLLKLARGARIVRRMQANYGFSYRHGVLYQLFCLVIIISHWIACTLGLLSRIQLDDRVCPPSVRDAQDAAALNCQYSWLTTYADNAESSDPEDFISPWDAYLISLHFSMSLLVHPSGYYPTKPGERIAFIVLMLFGGFVWTQVISKSTAIRASLDRHHLVYHQTMDDISEFSRDYNLSKTTQRKLRKFFIKTKDQLQVGAWKNLVERMSPQLRRDTAREINRTWVKQIGFLSQFWKSLGFITDIAQAMKTHLHGETEHFGEIGHMYVMVEGLASLTSLSSHHYVEDKDRSFRHMRVMSAGKAWGEDHLLLISVELLEDNSVVSLTFANVQSLSKKDFDEILSEYPKEQRLIRKKAISMAFVRYVRSEVRRRREEAMSDRDSHLLEDHAEHLTESALDSLQHKRAMNSRRLRAHKSLHSLSAVEFNRRPSDSSNPNGRIARMEEDIHRLSQRQTQMCEHQESMDRKLSAMMTILQNLQVSHFNDQDPLSEGCVNRVYLSDSTTV